MIGVSREAMLCEDCYRGASHKRRVRQNLLQVRGCGQQLLPFRQIAFGHKSSRSDIAGRMDQPDEVGLLEGFFREYPCGPERHRVVASSRQADHGQLRRLSLPVSTPHDSDDGATCAEL